MCKCNLIFRNVIEKIEKIFPAINLFIILFNLVIIFLVLVCLIQDKYEIYLKTGILSFINHIFFSFIKIILFILLEYYSCKNRLIRKKRSVSLIISIACFITSLTKSFSVFDPINKINKYKSLYIVNKTTIYNKYIIPNKQINKQKKYLTLIFIMLIAQLALFAIYIILICYINILFDNNNEINSQVDNIISEQSTEVEVNNDDENIINYLNNGKIRYKYYLSENIMNKIEKEYKDQMTQT